MNAFRPSAHKEEELLVVELLPLLAPCKVTTFDAVLDLTGLGDVVGFEILDFRRQLNATSPPANELVPLPRWSYDDEIDAFYVRLAEGTASVQRSVVGLADVDERGRIIRLKIST